MKTNNFDLAALIIRIAAGGFMLTHGFGKLMKVLDGDMSFGDPIGIGPAASLILVVFAEFFCALFILVGFKTKWSTIPLIITMLVAAFIAHGADPFGKKEMALIYMMMYAALFFMGSGKHSIDAMLNKKR